MDQDPFLQGPMAPHGLTRFNTAPFPVAEAALLECCGSTRWAHRVASYRPYPDLDSLLAASDEAGYDLSPTDVTEALAGETAPSLREDAPHAARLALQAAHAAYVTKFDHAFVLCLDGHRPSHHVDQVLAGIRARLAHDPDEERSVTAEEMRRLARERIIELVSAPSPGTAADTVPGPETPSPSVADRLPL
ncbi:2-oxo-4-hydroxy-4-carboxy-5-ureidoimidazoline decarboxylase [Streptomyces sp. NPDC008125]|uniref:2-oxo-4-hydroxy-4-carboxy-5-ureidoimidazoline decarboxylase n=1 Tax=Streptomyces sp. NPDC008125 TaxID=3364811 RepID=UPI0036EBF182